MRKKQSNYVKWARKVRGEPESVADKDTLVVYTSLYSENNLTAGTVVRFVAHPYGGDSFGLYPVGEEHTLVRHPSGWEWV